MATDPAAQLKAITERRVAALESAFVTNVTTAYKAMAPRSPGPGALFVGREPRHPEGRIADALVVRHEGNIVTLSVDTVRAPHALWTDRPPAGLITSRDRKRQMRWFDTNLGQQAWRFVKPSLLHAGWWSRSFRRTTLPQVIRDLRSKTT